MKYRYNHSNFKVASIVNDMLHIKDISRSLNYFSYVTVENLRRRNTFWSSKFTINNFFDKKDKQNGRKYKLDSLSLITCLALVNFLHVLIFIDQSSNTSIFYISLILSVVQSVRIVHSIFSTLSHSNWNTKY